jgi:hypothetical protein
MITRRDLLKGAAAAALAGCASPSRASVRSENERPGTTDWILTNTRAVAKCRSPWIEGFCSRTSVRAGETIEFKVSTNPPSSFTLDLYRSGYYGGKGGRHVATLGPFKGSVQPDPAPGRDRVRECVWETSAKVTIPSDWPSGVYLGKLTEEREKLQSYVIFVVRDDRPCDFLFQVSDTTWAAYNRWPDLWSLYDDGTPPHNWYTGPGVAVSFDRPYGKYRQILDAPLSQGSGEWLLWEFNLAYWMEANGYDVSYISNLDTHADPAGLRRAKAFISQAHDEYWSLDMYRNAKAAIDAGLHAAFLSGNAVDGVIDVRPSALGPHRSIARIGKFGGNHPYEYKTPWTQHGPDPALLMGARTTDPANGSASWTCVKPDHWLFEGTGMKAGDAIRDLVGWEHHGPPLSIPGIEVLARGPVLGGGKPKGVEYTSTMHRSPAGGIVFNAATIWWSLALAHPPGYLPCKAHGGEPIAVDARVQEMTHNLLTRFTA